MAAAPIFLLKRDISIIQMVQSFGGCTVEQVSRRLFPTLTSSRACYRRVAELVSKGYLSARRLASLSGIGSGKHFLMPTPRGRGIVAAALGVRTSELKRLRATAPRFIEHHLAVGDTRIAFEISAERSGVFTFVEWLGDREVEVSAELEGPKGKVRVSLTPDSTCTVGLPDGRTQQFFLEQDMATMTSRTRMKTRLHGYLVACSHHSIPVLFVTTTAERLRALSELALEIAQQHQLNARVIWLTTAPQLAAEDALTSPIWIIPGQSGATSVSAMMSTGMDKAAGGRVE